jgi:hypothetical protein
MEITLKTYILNVKNIIFFQFFIKFTQTLQKKINLKFNQLLTCITYICIVI